MTFLQRESVDGYLMLINGPRKLPNSVKLGKIMAIMPFWVIQGHRFWYQSKAHLQQHTFFIWWSLLLARLPCPLWKSPIAPLGMLHLVCWTNSPLISATLVRHSLTLSHITHGSSSSSLSPLASSLIRSVFHSELKLGFLADSFLHRSFPFLSDWFHGLSDYLVSIILNGWICLHGVLD